MVLIEKSQNFEMKRLRDSLNRHNRRLLSRGIDIFCPLDKCHLTPLQKAYRIANINVLPLKSGPAIG